MKLKTFATLFSLRIKHLTLSNKPERILNKNEQQKIFKGHNVSNF